MLSIAQSSNYFHFVEWSPSESGPKVLKFKKIKHNVDYFNKNLLNDLISDFNPVSKEESNSLTYSIDSNYVGLSSFAVDPKINLSEYISWYEKNMLNNYFLDTFDLFYYPINDTNVMVISINKKIKNNLVKSSIDLGYKMMNFTVDIFSANQMVTQMYCENKIQNYLLWKIDKNNHHYFLYIKNNKFQNLIKVRYSNKIVDYLVNVGVNENEKILRNIESVLKGENGSTDKIFLYQTKIDTKDISNILNKNLDNLVLMDPSSFISMKGANKNKFKFLAYNENGISLRGVDV
ncbi:MAG: hypothetical protein CMG64_03085 [Candidatus Marinimicrobia bacterium]|nr:hypothetical protein [Candidatus Neomarinimicrobiota bacterium]